MKDTHQDESRRFPGPAAAVLRLLTVAQTARELNCSPRTVWRLIGAAELRVIRLGKAVRVTRESIEEFVGRGGSQ